MNQSNSNNLLGTHQDISKLDPAELVMPYRILAKDDKFYPQLFKVNFGTERKGPVRYDTEEGARKFLKKQADHRVLISAQYFKKHGKPHNAVVEHEKTWAENIHTAPLVVEESAPVVEEPKKPYRYNPMQMKYIVIKSEDRNGRVHELPVMFPYVLVHKEMKECVWRALMESDHRFIEVVGAGFCTVENNVVKCYGESESLGISSRGKLDTQAFDRCERSETSTIVEK